MSTHRVLLVEDDLKLGRQVCQQLQAAQLEVDWVQDGTSALERRPRDFNLWILDLMLPGTYGLDLIKHVRTQGDVPILVLSALNETPTKVRALELGADDFLTKPFWPEELLARVQARLRRPVAVREDRLDFGDLSLDLAARKCSLSGTDLDLTRLEFELLLKLAQRPGTAFRRAQIAADVLVRDNENIERALDAHVSRLRRKLGPCCACIETVWGIGYRFTPPPA